MPHRILGPNGEPISTRNLPFQFGIDERAEMYKGMGFLPNEDDLIERKGFEIYDIMMRDVEVKNAVDSKRNAVVSSKWEIIPASDSKLDIEVADFVRWNFKNVKGTVRHTLFQILSAIARGYSVTEKNFRVITEGRFRGKWAIREFKAKYAGDYEIQTDIYLNITALKLTTLNHAEGDPVPLDKFILYTYNPKDGQPHGQSDLRAVYKHYWAKDFLLKWWTIYCETFGMPIRTVSYPPGAYPQSDSGDKTSQRRLQEILEDILNGTAITLPEDIKVQFIETAKEGGVAFKNVILYHDTQIKTGILGQPLTSGQGMGQAPFALAKVHDETKQDFVAVLRSELEDLVYEQVIRQLVDLNYVVESYPTFFMSPRSRRVEDLTADELSKLDALKIQVLDESDVDILRDKIGLPKKAIQKEIAETEEEIFGKSKFSRADYAIKKKLRNEFDKDETSLIDALSTVVLQMKENLLRVLPKKFFDGDKLDTTALKNMQLIGLGDFNKTYKEHLIAVNKQQSGESLKEVRGGAISKNARISSKEVERYAKIELTERRHPSKEIAKIIRWQETGDFQKIAAWRSANATAAQRAIAAESFTITDIVKTDILRDVKNKLFNGSRNGASVAQMTKMVNDVFEDYIERGDIKNKALADAPKLENIVRVNLNRVFNEARHESFIEGAATGVFPAMKYVTIADSRRSEICDDLDGLIYLVDDPIWNSIRPPNHLHCRSSITPVHRDDLPTRFPPNPNLNIIPSEFGGTG